MNAYTRSHVEAHAGAIMRDEPFTEGVLWINRAPCGAGATSGCEHLLPRMIPTGKRLFVYVMPKGTTGAIPRPLVIDGVGRRRRRGPSG